MYSISVIQYINPIIKMSTSKVDSYINGTLQIQQCRSDILKRMEKIKQKIDLIEKQEKQHPQDHAQQFVNRFGKDLKFLLRQFEQFQRVVSRLEKQVYERHDPAKQILITTIRQQIRRFHGLIPENMQEQITKSKLRARRSRNVESVISDDEAPPITKVEIERVQSDQNKKEQIKPEQKMSQNRETNDIDVSTSQEIGNKEQNEQLLQNLQQFLLLQQQTPKPPEQQSETESLIGANSLKNSIRESTHSGPQSQPNQQYEQQQKIERDRYKKFIYLEKIKQKYSHIKTAGKVLLCILILAVILFCLLSYAVYRAVLTITSDL